MESWITFWTVVCIIGVSAFYLLVAAIIPLGFRDLLEMFRRLGAERKEDTGSLPLNAERKVKNAK